MTPEEIYKQITHLNDCALIDEAIKALENWRKDYAFKMCDEQRRECANAAMIDYHSKDFTVRKIAPIIRQKVMVSEPDRPSIYNAPYPKELQ